MPKLVPTGASVAEFLAAVPDAGRRADASVLLGLMRRVTGREPEMWGPSIVGFGTYHYRYESGHEGNAPLAAFSPRKANLVVYLAPELLAAPATLARLGKHRASKGCLYLGRLTGVNLGALEELVAASAALVEERHA